MSSRTAKFVSAVFASLLAGIPLTTVSHSAVTPAETCLSGPKGAPPKGGHWYYRIDRATKRHCWYVGDAKEKPSRVASQNPSASQEPRPVDRGCPRRIADAADASGAGRRRRDRSSECGEYRWWRASRRGGREPTAIGHRIALARTARHQRVTRSGTGERSFRRERSIEFSGAFTCPCRCHPGRGGLLLRKTVRRDPDAVDRRHQRPVARGTDGKRDLPVRRHDAVERPARNSFRAPRDLGSGRRRASIARRLRGG